MIEACSLSLRIARLPLLSEMNFALRAGEFVAVLGPNGVGKTTLLRAIAGLHPPSGGTLAVNGKPVSQYSPTERARAIAFMVSDDSPVESMSVRDVVASGRFPYHRWWEWREHERDAIVIADALQAVHMGEFASRAFGTLSSGERQRVWLALGLAQEPPILLLDEPTSHLDVRVSNEILHLLQTQARWGRCVVCVLHDMNEALEFADRLMVLADGHLLAIDSPERIVAGGFLETAYGIGLEILQGAESVRVFPRSVSTGPRAGA